MSIELIVASVAITCALVLYTFGVFGERRSGTLSLCCCFGAASCAIPPAR